jgi:mannose/fructose/N-acetylgalactosamine-specific phosphotransferase system component IIC
VAGGIALVAAVIAVFEGKWPEAALFLAAALALAVVTLRTVRR